MLLSVSRITFQVFRTAHTPNPMSYCDTSPSPVKMDREYRLSQPVNCLRNHLISWEFDRKIKLWVCQKPFYLAWHISLPKYIKLSSLWSSIQSRRRHSCARTHTHTHTSHWWGQSQNGTNGRWELTVNKCHLNPHNYQAFYQHCLKPRCLPSTSATAALQQRQLMRSC